MKKKKRRSRAKNSAGGGESRDRVDEEQNEGLRTLMEAFGSISVEQAKTAFNEANGDVNKAAELLGASLVNDGEDQSTSSVSSGVSGFSSGWNWGSSSSSGSSSGLGSEGAMELERTCIENVKGSVKRNKQKKVVASAGTVSAMLGKDYVKTIPKRGSMKQKGIYNEEVDKAEAEQFLCSMLGDDCELSIAVVRDVLCECGYDIEKALNALLDLSASSPKQSQDGRCVPDGVSTKRDAGFLEHNDELTDWPSDGNSRMSESEVYENEWCVGSGFRTNSRTFASSEFQPNPRSTESDLPHKVLESLFNVPKSSKHEPDSMNWRSVVKKLESLGSGFNLYPSSATESQRQNYAKGEEYHALRKDAENRWNSTKSLYQRAGEAYSRGERQYASYLSEQGKVQTRLAREADARASHDIFKARNRDIENVVTIDLHGQHVKQAMKLLKVHLLFGVYVPSVQTLRVITGCGTHGLGKSKVKQSVIDLLEREGIKWSEENRGTVLIKLDGYKEFSFLDGDSDID